LYDVVGARQHGAYAYNHPEEEEYQQQPRFVSVAGLFRDKESSPEGKAQEY